MKSVEPEGLGMQAALNSEHPENKDWLTHIKIGQRFDLELLDQRKSRCSGELVGYKAGKYVMFRLDDECLPDRYFLHGLAIICRFLVEDLIGECFAFKTELLQFMRFPDKLVVVGFPQNIQSRSLRHEKRNSILIPASVRLDLDVVQSPRCFKGLLVDLSSGGCRFLFDSSYKANKVHLAPVVIHLQCEKSGINTQIQGEVRSSRLEDRGLTIGIQFHQTQQQLDKLVTA